MNRLPTTPFGRPDYSRRSGAVICWCRCGVAAVAAAAAVAAGAAAAGLLWIAGSAGDGSQPP